MNLSHILNHLGEDRDKYYKAISPPIIQSSNFAFDKVDDLRQMLTDESAHHIYTRGNNPTVEILRKKVAALESAEDALVFGSGAAAIAMAVLGNVQAGDHIICVQSPYGWTYKLLTKFLARFGVSHTFVDGTSMEAIEAAIQPNSQVLFLESPNSMTFELQNLKACATLAKKHGLVTMIDNSYASPIFQRPIEFGIDIVIHSGTKYLNGHSDVVVGVLCSSKAMVGKLFLSELMTLGAIISPHDAALVIRGLRTLPLRMQHSHDSAMDIVHRLEQHPKIEQVYYPFATDFPQRELAQEQMSGAGGLFSVLLKANSIEQVEKFCNELDCFTMAASWGGHESLIIPICAFYNIAGRENSPLPWNLVRFYVGLEDVNWLWADIKKGLEKL